VGREVNGKNGKIYIWVWVGVRVDGLAKVKFLGKKLKKWL
jgi:hypothetical protein